MRRARLPLVVLLATVAAACASTPAGPTGSLSVLVPPARQCAVQSPDAPAPSGTLVVGYPDEPVAWLPALAEDVASGDLAALWGLPLFDLDAAGQLRTRLVREALVLGDGGGGWQVRLILCEGRWSDDTPVVAEDVVATIEALRGTPAATLLASITAAQVEGPDVVITLDARTGRWQHLLADLGPILPAHVLAEQGIEAYRDDVPVAGGSFQLDAQEIGQARTFTANAGSVLGPPRSETLVVKVVPRFELALGLLAAGELDVALGHLPLEADARIEAVAGVEGQVGRGSTVLTWQWQPKAALPDPVARARVHGAFDLGPLAEALLDGQGRVRRSFVAGANGPPASPASRLDGFPELIAASSKWSETEALVARAVIDGVERYGGTMRSASAEADVLFSGSLGDGHVVTRRLGPWPSLQWLAGVEAADFNVLARADHASHAASSQVEAGLRALDLLAIEVPLVEVAVSHAWREGVSGVSPSGWPGIGFTSAAEWAAAP